ncbi:hypothetical protein AARAC_009887 [Aspergillus arachidicola]|uniref:Glutathione S-transferase n=1 Tax=Aspergillus arachidicola TaxID=656916 RepID=A0A2G7G9E2_9EURO|nr:hypothetical protein AARAC_009887 [Aspergillus arachidicola]
MEPITVFVSQMGPNPWKVVLMLEELQLPYKTEFVDFSEVKKEPYVNINPNGRLPAMQDPNTGVQIWESGAIVEYIIDTYDKENQLSYETSLEKWQLRQWLFFQKVQSAIDRYRDEVYRVTGVLDNYLQTRQWLVGDKCTYADLSFIAWQRNAPRLCGEGFYDKFPHAYAWMKRMEARPTVQKVYSMQDKIMTEHALN